MKCNKKDLKTFETKHKLEKEQKGENTHSFVIVSPEAIPNQRCRTKVDFPIPIPNPSKYWNIGV